MLQMYIGIAILLFGVESSVGSNDGNAGDLLVPVSWDYGSGPGKDSNRWVGQREIPIRYHSRDCADRFRLTSVRHEYLLVDHEGRKSAPAFIVATFQKLVPGDVDPPYLEIARPHYTKGGVETTKRHVDAVGFRLDYPPNGVDNWNDADIEVTLSAPNHDLHNPFGWTEVVVSCEEGHISPMPQEWRVETGDDGRISVRPAGDERAPSESGDSVFVVAPDGKLPAIKVSSLPIGAAIRDDVYRRIRGSAWDHEPEWSEGSWTILPSSDGVVVMGRGYAHRRVFAIGEGRCILVEASYPKDTKKKLRRAVSERMTTVLLETIAESTSETAEGGQTPGMERFNQWLTRKNLESAMDIVVTEAER